MSIGAAQRDLKGGLEFVYIIQVVRTVLRTALLTPSRLEQTILSTNTELRSAIAAI